MRKITTTLLLITLLISPLSLLATTLFVDKAEVILIESLNYAEQQKWKQAKERAAQLQQQYPNFKAAAQLQHLLENQQLPLQLEAPLIKPWTNEYTNSNLIAELSLRWAFSKRTSHLNKKPASIVQLAENVRHALVVETNTSRAYLYKNIQGQPEYIGNFYIAIGKLAIGKNKQGKQKEGDHLTPLGIYKVDSYRPDEKLQEIYGIGALTLNYPNALDKRLKKTGNGIWLHGVPRETYSRPPNSSRGCVTMSNDIFTQLQAFIDIKTSPIIITDRIQWVNKTEAHNVVASLNAWKLAWESKNLTNYFSHYDSSFKGNSHNQWKQDKKIINQAKEYINIEINQLSIYEYPKNKNIVVTEFEQNYKSNNFNGLSNKKIYWEKVNNDYKIILEHQL